MDNEARQPDGRARLTAWPLIALVRLYQVTLGAFMGGHCRFHPTCSFYAVEALKVHGAFRGSWLTIRRLLRCHPFGGAGYDPVPPAHRRASETSADSPRRVDDPSASSRHL